MLGLGAAQPGRAEVLSAGERGDRVLIPAGAVDHDDLGHAAGVAEGGSVGQRTGDMHRAEVSQRQDATAGRAARPGGSACRGGRPIVVAFRLLACRLRARQTGRSCPVREPLCGFVGLARGCGESTLGESNAGDRYRKRFVSNILCLCSRSSPPNAPLPAQNHIPAQVPWTPGRGAGRDGAHCHCRAFHLSRRTPYPVHTAWMSQPCTLSSMNAASMSYDPVPVMPSRFRPASRTGPG